MSNFFKGMSQEERLEFIREHHIMTPARRLELAKKAAASEETQRFLKAHSVQRKTNLA